MNIQHCNSFCNHKHFIASSPIVHTYVHRPYSGFLLPCCCAKLVHPARSCNSFCASQLKLQRVHITACYAQSLLFCCLSSHPVSSFACPQRRAIIVISEDLQQRGYKNIVLGHSLWGLYCYSYFSTTWEGDTVTA